MMKHPRLTFIAALVAALCLLWGWHTIDVLTRPPDSPAVSALHEDDAADDSARWKLLKDGIVLAGTVAGGLLVLGVLAAGGVMLVRAITTADLIYTDAEGRWPVERPALADPALGAASVAAWHNTQALAARASRQMPTSYHKEIHGWLPDQAPVEGEWREEDPTPVPAPDLPGPCTLLDVLRDGFTPSADAILLGLGPGGVRLTVPADDTMCHLLLAGQTGRGKSVLFRLLMTQLLLAGLDVRWLDLAYSPFDTRRKIDLRPLAARVTGGPLTDAGEITAFFTYLAGAELTTRKARRRATGDSGPTFFAFADEWPQLIGAYPDLATPAAACLRLYRQFNGYFAVGSQDGLVETMGLNSGELGQFATRYYVGGADATTRKRLTGSTQTADPPGKGLVFLSAAPLERPALVRVPNVSNLDLYETLGWPSSPPSWGWDSPPRRAFPAAVAPVLSPPIAAELARAYRAVQGTATPEPLEPLEASALRPRPGTETTLLEPLEASSRKEQARALLAGGMRPAAVVRQLWGLSTNKGRVADDAADELAGWITEWVQPGPTPAEGQEHSEQPETA